MKRIIVALLLLSTVSACAVPISSGDMKPVTEAQIAISPNQKLAGKLAVGNVQVGDEAKVYGAITPDAYKDALQSALLSSNYLTRGRAKINIPSMRRCKRWIIQQLVLILIAMPQRRTACETV